MKIRWATLIVRLSTLRYGSWSPSRFQGSDAATRGLDQDAAYIVTALFLITAVPALVLNYTVGRQELHSSSGSLTRRRLRPCLWR